MRMWINKINRFLERFLYWNIIIHYLFDYIKFFNTCFTLFMFSRAVEVEIPTYRVYLY